MYRMYKDITRPLRHSTFVDQYIDRIDVQLHHLKTKYPNYQKEQEESDHHYFLNIANNLEVMAKLIVYISAIELLQTATNSIAFMRILRNFTQPVYMNFIEDLYDKLRHDVPKTLRYLKKQYKYKLKIIYQDLIKRLTTLYTKMKKIFSKERYQY